MEYILSLLIMFCASYLIVNDNCYDTSHMIIRTLLICVLTFSAITLGVFVVK